MKLFFGNNGLFYTSLIAAGITAAAFVPSAQAHHETESLPIYPQDAPDTCDASKVQIRVTVKGATHVGLVKLELYSDAQPKDFLEKDGRLRTIRIPAQDEPVIVCIDVDGPGGYAVSGYHDQDADRKLDKKWNFRPKEPYGMTRIEDFKAKRKPKFEEAAFEVTEAGADVDFILVDLGNL